MTIVTLTTDFGTSDGYVGAMKGVILSRAAGARIVDIAHHIAHHDVAAGAFCLRQAAAYFPEGTIHVAVVDPGVGTERQPVIVDDGRHLFVGPDNGLFSLVAPAPRAAHAIEAPAFRLPRVSATFHGRDVFAAAAGALAAGMPPDAAGPAVTLRGRLDLAREAVSSAPAGARRTATVIHVDAFGNLITDCPGHALPPAPRVRVAGREIEGLSRTFGDVASGMLVAYVGSADTLEIAVREDSAARILGVGRGATLAIIDAGDLGDG